MTNSGLLDTGSPCLTVVVVTYNSARVIGALLDSLPEGLEGIAATEVVVVDNGSKDGSAMIAASHAVGARVIQTGRNLGYAAAINVALATIHKGSHVLVLNPDIRLEPGCAITLVDGLLDEGVGATVPQLLKEDGSLAYSLRREPSVITSWADSVLGTRVAGRLGIGEVVMAPRSYSEGGEVEWATGAALAISAQARQLVGAWDESFFLYSEEVDYMERIRRCGLKVVYEPRARAMHIGGDYQSNTKLSALMTANRIVYFARHHSRLATVIFRLGIIAGETVRFGLGPGHRAALSAALRPHLEYRSVLQG